MRFTHFTITQGGHLIGNVAIREQAVNAAKSRAADTGRPVSVTGHIDGGGTREVIFKPDGSCNKIWEIDKGRSFMPAVGQVYKNRGGGDYLCLDQLPATGALYHHQAGSSSGTAAIFRNVKSGWTFTAKGIIQYVDGTIEWDHSTDGRFEEVAT